MNKTKKLHVRTGDQPHVANTTAQFPFGLHGYDTAALPHLHLPQAHRGADLSLS